ncbi:MAG: antibiotic biosynthesis monooxygenase [Hyphomicrobiales bacterium]|nr:MAG: antibiotic biosynthesis monooxygenase [Hyphomicrobiales bacterium]
MLTNQRVYLNGHIDVPVDQWHAVVLALPTHIELTREEPGCISFKVTQSTSVECRFLVAEIFEDQAAFEAHQERTKASEWAKITADCPRDFTIKTQD